MRTERMRTERMRTERMRTERMRTERMRTERMRTERNTKELFETQDRSTRSGSGAVIALLVCLAVLVGAVVNAALVTWMFTSSQVIAPIPV